MKDAYSPILRNQKINVGSTERILSVLGGSYLLYDALTSRRTSMTEALLGGYLLFRGTTGYCPVHGMIEDRPAQEHSQNINIRVNMTVNRNRMDVYNFWRKLENLPLFMSHIKKVHELDSKTSEWTATGPGGIGSVSWKAEIVKDEPGRLLSWRSLLDSTIENAGKVEFLDQGALGTTLHVVITYKAPLGVPGKELARLLNPMFEDIVKDDVLNFKSYMETGETLTMNDVQGTDEGMLE
ncbi:SRPBCC family protein [Telluribacter sp. SYSU D00476]|uniref:SRPBCC family protein n=1 Tax=Telluribacter sp. SYSU D00476 TaxID=2811430 RepID=UPI001FF2B1B8|nr:YgaP-like transmembrane domain [Telluribacter sp. SYSU D00476]